MSGFGRSVTDEETRLTFLNGEVGKVEKRLDEIQEEKELAEQNYAKVLVEFDATITDRELRLNKLESQLENLEIDRETWLDRIEELKKAVKEATTALNVGRRELEKQDQASKEAETALDSAIVRADEIVS